MGLTGSSVGINAARDVPVIVRNSPDERVIALAGNPNVGKSTVFNGLTGMNQHTGNWPGKTVSSAYGRVRSENFEYVMVDIPGTYSLSAHSAEEEVARDFICFGRPDATVVVCDATCLSRNLNLVLQTAEVSPNIIVCVNLMDEAKRKGIRIDTDILSQKLGLPVVSSVARDKKSLSTLLRAMDKISSGKYIPSPACTGYPEEIENAVRLLSDAIEKHGNGKLDSRFTALRLIEDDDSFSEKIYTCICDSDSARSALKAEASGIREKLREIYGAEGVRDAVVTAINNRAEEIFRESVTYKHKAYDRADRRIDRFLTGRVSGYAVMLLMLALIFWLTISGANYPSELLSRLLFGFQDVLTGLFEKAGAPQWLHGIVVLGAYRVLAWVVSVMLPPMAIFFPLFTLLEDVGYLPRIAYNLDKPLQCCGACGKQALCMAMGFGCNAAGVVGCRIIDSPRERLLAIVTNNFVPCNGRFPTLIAIITMFFIVGGSSGGISASVLSALLLTVIILIGIAVSFAVTRILSKTLLRGMPSSFTLELPPYRRPQIGKVIIRSIFDRTLFVLGRAATVAIPAGILLWITANVTVGDATLLSHCAGFLDPLGRLMGLDGVILIAFILGFPANEIVLPIIIMAYTASGSLSEIGNLDAIRELFVSNGWTWLTAACTMLFSLMHWPCSTTLLTIKHETGSIKWTVLSAVIPTVIGIALCIIVASAARLTGLA